MAGYSIVLNITGNASNQAAKLATNLERADIAAKSLAATLPAISRGMRGVGAAQIRAMGTANAQALRAQASAQNTLLAGEARRARQEAAYARREASAATRRGAHRSSARLFYGTGFNVGGFSGRFGSIIRPDEAGNLLGMNAESLMSKVNIAGIAGNLMLGIGKALLKLTAYSSFAPLVVGGGTLMVALRALQSESFAEGVRLISRRHQARMGLGANFLQAQENADYLAASYGLDRSTAISSINVLTGLGVGNTGRKINLGEATDLTKIGGIISQHHGVPYERVMTNIQQLLVQSTPHMRDIRELLNQAPILGRYARNEMESRGIKGSPLDYLKDQRNILSVLKRYEMDTATNAGMQARGRIALASQDAWATVASNDRFWQMMGDAGERTIRVIGDSVNNLMTGLTNSPEFANMLRNIEYAFQNIGTNGAEFLGKLITFIDGVSATFGIDLGDRRKARSETAVESTIKGAINKPYINSLLRKEWEAAGGAISNDPAVNQKAFETFIANEFTREAIKDKGVRADVVTFGAEMNSIGDYSLAARWGLGPVFSNTMVGIANRDKRQDALNTALSAAKKANTGTFFYTPAISNLANPTAAYGAYALDEEKLVNLARKMLNDKKSMGGLDPSSFSATGADGTLGSDLKGMNRDRRSLEIHFHDKIIEWNSTIVSDDPKATVDEVADNVEQLVSAGLQKALLGATGKMSSSWL